MTRLWIDGIEAVLPETFSISVKRENPFFTKNGEYTYDITLSLLNNINADLYAHLNRLNSVTEVKSKRRALLMADNRVYCDGTEVITGWTEKQVTIQVASGNSELNYLIGGDLQIEWLTLLDDETKRQIADSANNKERFINSLYPDVAFNFCPCAIESRVRIQNLWQLDMETGSISSLFATYWVQQPYLCAVIRLLCQALGYTMVENQIEATPYKNLYMVSGRQDNPDWGQLLKGWSALEFFEQVESMFNAQFVVNNRRREISLVLKTQYYAGGKVCHVRHVADSYETDCPDSPDVDDVTAMNVGYNGTSDWWKWMKLDEELVKSAKRVTIPADYPDGNYVRPYNYFLDEAHQKKDTIYIDETNGRQYIWVGEPLGNHDVNWGWSNQPIIRYRRVNALANYEREGAKDTLSLDMIPAEFVWKPTTDMHLKLSYLLSVPKAENAFDYLISSTEEESLDINGRITGEQSAKSDNNKAPIHLAFYDGMKQIDTIDGKVIRFPIPYIIDTIELPAYITLAYRDSNTVGASLAPEVMNAQFYGDAYDIDFNHEVKIKSYDPNVFDPSSVWEVKNKRYVCKEVEYTLNARGRLGAWTATLYPIRISDTEAESRWILSDGKWRDGGVWIDNGRWLDE